MSGVHIDSSDAELRSTSVPARPPSRPLGRSN